MFSVESPWLLKNRYHMWIRLTHVMYESLSFPCHHWIRILKILLLWTCVHIVVLMTLCYGNPNAQERNGDIIHNKFFVAILLFVVDIIWSCPRCYVYGYSCCQYVYYWLFFVTVILSKLFWCDLIMVIVLLHCFSY